MKKTTEIFVFLALLVSVISGCNNQKITDSESVTLTFWGSNTLTDTISSYNEVESLKQMQKNIGINIEYIHPSTAAIEAQFNILMASGEYPDLIQHNWNTAYTGGTEKAYKDGVIIKLDDYMDKLPNYSKILEDYPESANVVKQVNGSLYLFATFRNDTLSNSFYGHMIRQDWLDKLGLEMPNTIEDWYNVLTAFKNRDPNGNGMADEIPYAAWKGVDFAQYSSAWGVMKSTFQPTVDGRFAYGSIEPEYKEYLTEMNKWYKEGLIDSEFASIDKSIADYNMSNDISGATTGYIGSQMGSYIAARKNDSQYKISGAPWPSLKKGSANYIGTQIMRVVGHGVGTAITSKCKNIDAALKYMDYCYSEEATVLQNWGIEGVTYTKDDNGYKLTDYVAKNPSGLSPVQAINPYALTGFGLPPKMMLGDAYAAVMYNSPSQAQAARLWTVGDDTLLTVDYPLTGEENKQLGAIMSEITPYEDEMFAKMVMGLEPLSKFDEYVSTMKALGIEDAIKIRKTAYYRYLSK